MLRASPAGAPHPAPPSPTWPQVTCGSLVKLEHERLKVVLHSHEVAYGYGRGSGQQSVTGYPLKDSSDSMWIVRTAEVGVGE